MCEAPLLLNLLVTHLDLAVYHKSWEARDKVGALTLSTVHERVLCALLLEVVLLLCAPRARVAAVHGDAWTLGRLVLLGWHKLSLLGHAGVGDVGALGAQPPLVDVKGENTDDHSECDTHDDGIAIHIYFRTGKEIANSGRKATLDFQGLQYLLEGLSELDDIVPKRCGLQLYRGVVSNLMNSVIRFFLYVNDSVK